MPRPARENLYKLPAARRAELSILSKPRRPEYAEVATDVYMDIQRLLGREVKRVTLSKLEPNRRRCYLLHQLAGAMLADGVMSGLVWNNPELVKPGISAARDCRLPKTANVLAKLSRRLPSAATRKRKATLEAWFEKNTSNPFLDNMERAGDSCELMQKGSIDPCIRLVVQAPDEFYSKAAK